MQGPARGNTKGSVLLSRLAFVRERGEETLKSVLALLPPDDRETLSSIVLSSGWYPFALNDGLDRAIATVVGGGDEPFEELGRRSAADNLGSVHRGFVHARDPHGLLRDSVRLYRLYYDTGTREYERRGPSSAVLRTRDAASFSVSDCLTVVGFFEKAIEMCGGHEVAVVERQCRALGGTHCEYTLEWAESVHV